MKTVLLLRWERANEVVPAANKQTREFKRFPDKKTMEAEILREAVEYGRAKKELRMCPCTGTTTNRCPGVLRVQVSIFVSQVI